MKSGKTLIIICIGLFLFGCKNQQGKSTVDYTTDSMADKGKRTQIEAIEIRITKNLLYDKYTLEDVYPYKDTTRHFQWEKIKDLLAYLEFEENGKTLWGVLTNYRNKNGEAPLIQHFIRNDYKHVSDTFGTERYQSAPLYALNDSSAPIRYGQDGSIVKILGNPDNELIKIEGVSFRGFWNVPKKYLQVIGDSIYFKNAVFVDITNQNITTLEKTDTAWLVRSMNPATTGKRNPPYGYATPTGMYLLQEKKVKMFYYKDGTTDIAGYAPFASRFTNGAYIHGVPTNHPNAPAIEYSRTLGTTPRSHMCVRNASSHAEFIYNWAPMQKTVVFVID